MREILRWLWIAVLSLFTLETAIAIIDWLARIDWLKDFIDHHPKVAAFERTPFWPLALLALFVILFLAERNLKQPKIVARYTNSRRFPNLHTVTVGQIFAEQEQTLGWDQTPFGWEWFVEVQLANESEVPTTIERVEVKVKVGKQFHRKRLVSAQHVADMQGYEMDMGRDGSGNDLGLHLGDQRYKLMPSLSLMNKINGVPLTTGIGHRGWLRFEVEGLTQLEVRDKPIFIDIWLVDALHHKHKVQHNKKSEALWDNQGLIFKNDYD